MTLYWWLPTFILHFIDRVALATTAQSDASELRAKYETYLLWGGVEGDGIAPMSFADFVRAVEPQVSA